MGKTLVLAEKPSVGKEIARVLGCHGGGSGYMAGAQYVVTWALGHLVELAEPEHYGSQYKTWSLDSLPMMPEKMALKVIPETAKQFGVVKTWLHSKEIDSLVIATDAGREGELVARWILDKAGFRKPIKRLWISSQTDKAIREGFANLKDGRAYLPLYRSAVCRAEADWLVGLNVTRAMTCHYGAQLSARAGADPHPGAHRAAGGGDQALRAQGLLHGAGGFGQILRHLAGREGADRHF